MPQVAPFHRERNKEEYHNNSRCGPGSEIPVHERVPGTGGKRLCKHCADLTAKGE